MMLGDLMTRLDDERFATEALMATGDLALIASVQQLACTRNEPVGTIISDAVAAFSNDAGPDEWTQLMSVASRSDNPGGAVLRTIMATRKSGPTSPCDGGQQGGP